MVRVIIVDNHALSRLGLRSILNNDPKFLISGDYRNFHAVKPLLPDLSPHLAIVDSTVNDECGFDVAQYLKRSSHQLKVIILTFSMDELQIERAVQNDIDGYIYKSAEADEILMGINKVLAGQKYFFRRSFFVLAARIHHNDSVCKSRLFQVMGN